MLSTIPLEILEEIALQLVESQPLGPPSDIIDLSTTCSRIHDRLSNPSFLARIFKFKFDTTAIRRRSVVSINSSGYADQLKKYCHVLKVIRSNDFDSLDVEEALFSAFVMMLENDGKNQCQLDWAGLDNYLFRYLREKLYAEASNGWPAENVCNALALWLMWMNTTEAKLRAESSEQRLEIINLILPFVTIVYRYPSSYFPPNHFNIPLPSFNTTHNTSVVTAHGPFPIYRNDMWTLYHYGLDQQPRVSPPLITIPAKLLYFSRREVIPFGIPPHLPLTRDHANQLGITEIGPTQEDVLEFNAHKAARVVPETKWHWWEDLSDHETARAEYGAYFPDLKVASAHWDVDWERLRFCVDGFKNPFDLMNKGPVYIPGTLSGLWQGRMIIPSQQHFDALLAAVMIPVGYAETTLNLSTVPLFMHLTEHHCISPNTPIPTPRDDINDGMNNAWFPPGMKMDPGHLPGCVVLSAFGHSERWKYERYRPSDPSDPSNVQNSHDENRCKMCLARAAEEEDYSPRTPPTDFESKYYMDVGLDGEDSRPLGDDEIMSFVSGTESEGEMEEDEEDENDSEGSEPIPHRRTKFPACHGVCDVIVSGETDMRHGQAWNHFTYHGRVRPWDGLIGILRVSRDRRLGNIFFYGYITGGQNFVGNWRIANTDPRIPAWEGAFAMTKRGD